MAVKRKLSDLVSDLTVEEKLEVTDSHTLEITESVSLSSYNETQNVTAPTTLEIASALSRSAPTKTGVPKLQKANLTESASSEAPKYMTFERKEARLRFDQVTSLVNLTKSLNRKRKGRGERITDNTLIRVAVDLLLSKADFIEGTTEEEIKAALNF